MYPRSGRNTTTRTAPSGRGKKLLGLLLQHRRNVHGWHWLRADDEDGHLRVPRHRRARGDRGNRKPATAVDVTALSPRSHRGRGWVGCGRPGRRRSVEACLAGRIFVGCRGRCRRLSPTGSMIRPRPPGEAISHRSRCQPSDRRLNLGPARCLGAPDAADPRAPITRRRILVRNTPCVVERRLHAAYRVMVECISADCPADDEECAAGLCFSES